MEFKIGGQAFDAYQPFAVRARRHLDALPDGDLLLTDELARILGAGTGTHTLRPSNPALADYSFNVKTSSTRRTVWGSKKTIESLKKELLNEN